MKSLVLTMALAFPYFASAYQCSGVDSSGNNVHTVVTIYPRPQIVNVSLQVGADNFSEVAKLSYWSDSNMGHSRCPGNWSGIKFVGQGPDSKLLLLSITTQTFFDGCGFPPSDTISIKSGNEVESIPLVCKD